MAPSCYYETQVDVYHRPTSKNLKTSKRQNIKKTKVSLNTIGKLLQWSPGLEVLLGLTRPSWGPYLQESVYKRIWRLRMTQPGISKRDIARKVCVHRNTVSGTLQRVAGGGTLMPNTNKRKLYSNRLLFDAGELAAVKCVINHDELYIQEVHLELHTLMGKSCESTRLCDGPCAGWESKWCAIVKAWGQAAVCMGLAVSCNYARNLSSSRQFDDLGVSAGAFPHSSLSPQKYSCAKEADPEAQANWIRLVWHWFKRRLLPAL